MSEDDGPSRLAVRQAAFLIGGTVVWTVLLFVLDHGAKWFAVALTAVAAFICVDGLRRSKNR